MFTRPAVTRPNVLPRCVSCSEAEQVSTTARRRMNPQRMRYTRPDRSRQGWQRSGGATLVTIVESPTSGFDDSNLYWSVGFQQRVLMTLPYFRKLYYELSPAWVAAGIFISNFPGATPFFSENALTDFYNRRHPWLSASEAALVGEMGELAFQRWRFEFTGWIRQDPGQFLGRTLNRIPYFWFMPSSFPNWKNLIIFPITALSFYGLYRMMRRAPGPGMALAAGFVGFPLVYYVTNLRTRYRFPIEWAILFLAAFAVMDHWNRAESTRRFFPWAAKPPNPSGIDKA